MALAPRQTAVALTPLPPLDDSCDDPCDTGYVGLASGHEEPNALGVALTPLLARKEQVEPGVALSPLRLFPPRAAGLQGQPGGQGGGTNATDGVDGAQSALHSTRGTNATRE